MCGNTSLPYQHVWREGLRASLITGKTIALFLPYRIRTRINQGFSTCDMKLSWLWIFRLTSVGCAMCSLGNRHQRFGASCRLQLPGKTIVLFHLQDRGSWFLLNFGSTYWTTRHLISEEDGLEVMLWACIRQVLGSNLGQGHLTILTEASRGFIHIIRSTIRCRSPIPALKKR
jgi:hypothetical protein